MQIIIINNSQDLQRYSQAGLPKGISQLIIENSALAAAHIDLIKQFLANISNENVESVVFKSDAKAGQRQERDCFGEKHYYFLCRLKSNASIKNISFQNILFLDSPNFSSLHDGLSGFDEVKFRFGNTFASKKVVDAFRAALEKKQERYKSSFFAFQKEFIQEMDLTTTPLNEGNEKQAEYEYYNSMVEWLINDDGEDVKKSLQAIPKPQAGN